MTGVANVMVRSIGTAVGRDFATVAAWEAATDDDLQAAESIEIGEVYDDDGVGFNETLTIAGAVTDPGHYRVLRAAKGHEYNAMAGTGVRIWHAASTVISIQELGFVLEGIGVEFTGVGNDGICVEIAEQCRLERVTAKQIGAVAAVAGGCFVCTAAVTWFARYCVAFGSGADAVGANYGFHQNNAGAVSILENCTVYGCRLTATSRGFLNTAGTMTARACIGSTNRGSDFQGAITMTRCLSSDATATGTGSWTLLTAAQTFKSVATLDFRLVRTSPAIEGGAYVVPGKPHAPVIFSDGTERLASHFSNGLGAAVGDISGNAYDGAVQGAAGWITTAIGPALALTGAGHHVTYPVASGVCRTGPKHTVMVWFERTGHAAANMTLWSEVGATNAVYKVVLASAAATSTVQVFIRKADNTVLLNETTATAPVSTGLIQQMALVDDNGAVTLYIDGAAVLTATYTRVDLGEALTPGVGRLHSTDSQLVGRIYDFRAWPVVIDSSRISLFFAPHPWSTYSGIAPRDIGNLSLWQMQRYDIGANEYVYEPPAWLASLKDHEFSFSTQLLGAAAATTISMPLWHAPTNDWFVRIDHLDIDIATADSVEVFWKLSTTEYSLVVKTADWQGQDMVQIGPVPGASLWARVNRAAGTPNARILGSGFLTM